MFLCVPVCSCVFLCVPVCSCVFLCVFLVCFSCVLLIPSTERYLRLTHQYRNNDDNCLHTGGNSMWQKVREIWAFVAAVYAEDYDYFWLGGDDVFMIPENMKAYLGSDRIHQMNEDPNNPGLFIGARKKEGGDMDKLFNSGGAGYVLSRKTLRALERQLSTCRPNQHGFWEDVNVALCLKNEGILPIDTRDDAGSERFHLFNPGHILSWRPPKPDPTKDWFYVYSMGNKVGMDCCSDESIVFHYVKEE